MSNPPSIVMQGLLVGGSLAQVSNASIDWYAIVSKMPATPDRCIALYDYGGASPDPKWNIDNPSVQIRVRAGINDYAVGFNKCKAIKDALLGIMSQDIDGDRWVSISMVSDINFLRRDDKDRPEWVMNFNIIKETALNVGAAREAL